MPYLRATHGRFGAAVSAHSAFIVSLLFFGTETQPGTNSLSLDSMRPLHIAVRVSQHFIKPERMATWIPLPAKSAENAINPVQCGFPALLTKDRDGR